MNKIIKKFLLCLTLVVGSSTASNKNVFSEGEESCITLSLVATGTITMGSYGAMLGSALGGPVGGVIGGVTGGVTGGLMVVIFEIHKDSFISLSKSDIQRVDGEHHKQMEALSEVVFWKKPNNRQK